MSQRPKKNHSTDDPRILVSGWVGAANIGDELIFRSLAAKLEQRGVKTLAMSIDPEETRRLHGTDAVGWYDARGVTRAVASSDGVILGPGGLLQDETSIWNLPAHLHRVFGARLARTPTLGLGLGVGPLASRTSRRLVRTALRSTPITVRDPESALPPLSVTSETALDLSNSTYGLPVPVAEPTDRIVASFRPFSGSGGLMPARQADLRTLAPDDRVVAAASALDDLSRRTSLLVHLLAFEAERDALYHDLIAGHMTVPVTTGVANVDSVFEEVARSRLVVGMRYHTVVSAVMSARPVVVIGYSPKARSLARHLGDGGLLVDNDPASYPEIVGGFELLDRGDRVAEFRAERRTAEAGNDAALDRFLLNL